jgi:predicted membrane-bound mannosyltransferase
MPDLTTTHWLAISVAIIFAIMYFYTLKTNNDLFKAIIKKHIDTKDSSKKETNETNETKSSKRTYNAVDMD